ncbi:MAG: cytochrome bc1 complex diheme cytochrome c subunit [Actinomycetota bacterium]
MSDLGRNQARIAVLICGAGLVAAGSLVAGFPNANVSVAQTPYRPTPEPTGAQDGRTMYLRDCAWCHGADATGTVNGPDLTDAGPALVDFMLSSGRMPISAPDRVVERNDPYYDAVEVEAIVRYVATIAASEPTIPELNLENADLGEGALLYEDNCAACHSTTGIGAALTSGRIAPPVRDATAVQVAEAVRTGPGTMPVFDENVLDEEQLGALVRYVVYLSDPSDKGGHPLGRLGPVSEGAVAWIIGLGLMIGVIRWIGTSS